VTLKLSVTVSDCKALQVSQLRKRLKELTLQVILKEVKADDLRLSIAEYTEPMVGAGVSLLPVVVEPPQLTVHASIEFPESINFFLRCAFDGTASFDRARRLSIEVRVEVGRNLLEIDQVTLVQGV
jgi:hypothetical protein